MSLAERLAVRRLEPEVMDDPRLEPARHHAALAALARMHRLSRSARLSWRPIEGLARALGGPLSVLDVATGGGELPLELWRRGARAGLELELAGCDKSPTALRWARAGAARAAAPLRFFEHDCLAAAFPGEWDVVCSSLFLHHLHDEEAVLLLQRMRACARRAVVVHDLERTSASWRLAWLATRLLTRSDVARTDALRSVAAALTPGEALALAGRAGLEGARVARAWPSRWVLVWRRVGVP